MRLEVEIVKSFFESSWSLSFFGGKQKMNKKVETKNFSLIFHSKSFLQTSCGCDEGKFHEIETDEISSKQTKI